VTDLGLPIAYTALQEDTPVYDREGTRIGVVEQVLADEPVDIFHGLIVHTLPLPGRHLFADADQISELHERGVVLSVARDDLHEPREEPKQTGGHDKPINEVLEAGLRRAWDWLRSHR
jgi:hypothetical protein